MRLIGWGIAAVFVVAFFVALQFSLRSRDVKSEERFFNSHSKAACADCHRVRATSQTLAAAAVQSERCTTCHQPSIQNATGVPLNFHLSKNKTCLECHRYHQVETISSGEDQFRVCFENSFQRGQCYSCHGPGEDTSHLSAAHRAAAGMFHSDVGMIGQLSPSEACLTCHSGTGTVAVSDLGDYYRSAPRFVEHGSHPVGVRVVTGEGVPGNRIVDHLDPRIQLINGRIECQTCHSLSGGRANGLLAVESRNELCRGCHRLD